MSVTPNVPSQVTSAAITFGPPERALFGWYHPPRSTPRGAAVLLCSAVGWEALATQRTYRELADRLSEAGFATMRFDLDGTGDSAGTDEDPERVEAWLHSIELAAAELHALSGVEQLSLFGIHLGATLAALVAPAIGFASTAVLWAPFVQGKQWSRQIRAYGLLSGRDPASDGDQEAAGFLYRAHTLDALSQIDLLKCAPAAARVLLLQKHSSSNETNLAAAWRARGAQVICEAHPGYAEMMQQSYKSQVPEQVIRRIVTWLSSEHPTTIDRQATVAALRTTSGIREPFLEEEPCFFGPGDQFFGIVTRPDRGKPDPRDHDCPAVVFLNTSSDYRVGPSRMYVPLSRQLAARGLTSFRFDSTGIGDHRGPRFHDAAQAYSESRLSEMTVVFDFLESHDVAKCFILVGLCSGAYVAFHAAVRDERVVGTVLINPQAFTWKPGDSLDLKIRQSFKSTQYYRREIRRFATWKRALSGRLNVIGVGRTLVRRWVAPALRMATRAIPSRWSNRFHVDRALQALLDRGSTVLVIFDENDGGRDVFDAHLGRDGGRFRRDPGFRLEIVRGADHTFSRVRDQRALLALLGGYLDDRSHVRRGSLGHSHDAAMTCQETRSGARSTGRSQFG
ncbi:MAG: alpha/beta fold hydrolase [Chloroflexota bacterium]